MWDVVCVCTCVRVRGCGWVRACVRVCVVRVGGMRGKRNIEINEFSGQFLHFYNEVGP